MKPRLLDLFCGAGGAAMGYHRAGFDVVGVDNKPQPHYPFEFIQADAMTYPLDGYDAIHASPPCQAYTRAGHLAVAQGNLRSTIDLIDPIRQRLQAARTPYVIENVEGSPIPNALLLCGSMFELRVRRHRLFESSIWLFGQDCRHIKQGRPVGVHNWGKWGHEIPHGGLMAASLQDAQDAMGINWMTRRRELSEAIPPAYTQYIGEQLLSVLTDRITT